MASVHCQGGDTGGQASAAAAPATEVLHVNKCVLGILESMFVNFVYLDALASLRLGTLESMFVKLVNLDTLASLHLGIVVPWHRCTLYQAQLEAAYYEDQQERQEHEEAWTHTIASWHLPTQQPPTHPPIDPPTHPERPSVAQPQQSQPRQVQQQQQSCQWRNRHHKTLLHLGIFASSHLGIFAHLHLGIFLGIFASWHICTFAPWHFRTLAFSHLGNCHQAAAAADDGEVAERSELEWL